MYNKMGIQKDHDANSKPREEAYARSQEKGTSEVIACIHAHLVVAQVDLSEEDGGGGHHSAEEASTKGLTRAEVSGDADAVTGFAGVAAVQGRVTAELDVHQVVYAALLVVASGLGASRCVGVIKNKRLLSEDR
jgi:hypothetical protein